MLLKYAGERLNFLIISFHIYCKYDSLSSYCSFAYGLMEYIPRKAITCGFSLAMNTTALLRLAIACYSVPSRLALDAHCSPKKTQFATFLGMQKLLKKNLYPESFFGEISEGQQFLSRLIFATIFVFGIMCGVGAGRISLVPAPKN